MNSVALVTGGNRGIGLAVAHSLAAAGHDVVVTYRSGSAPAGFKSVIMDVTSTESVDKAFDEIEAQWGIPEIIVANAGITKDGLVMRMSDEDFESVIDANLTGAFRVARRATKGLLKLKKGRLIFVGSVVGALGSAGQVNYSSSKSGLVGMARSFAREIGSRGITANVVAPGFVETDMTSTLDEKRRNEIAGSIPLGRFCSAQEIADVVTFIASPQASYISGALIPVDGGLEWVTDMGLLDGKKILVTGVLTDSSIAFHIARLAQEQGAQVVLSSYGRVLSLTTRIAGRLPNPAAIIELDVTNEADLTALESRVRAHFPDGLDGVVHSIGFAPEAALGGNFLNTSWEDVSTAMHVSAYSLKSLTMAAKPLFTGGGSVVGLDFDATVAWPKYDWMGVAKAALESTSRYLARDLGGQNIRVNLVAAGPIRTMAAKSIPGFDEFEKVWNERAPLAWDVTDPVPAAQAVVALLSDWFPKTTGEIIHVDGGVHAMGA